MKNTQKKIEITCARIASKVNAQRQGRQQLIQSSTGKRKDYEGTSFTSSQNRESVKFASMMGSPISITNRTHQESANSLLG